jgi:hypothetical protein
MWFTIDESRRAHGVRGTGAPTAAIACLSSALGSVRTESTPDIGNAEVVVDIKFASRS